VLNPELFDAIVPDAAKMYQDQIGESSSLLHLLELWIAKAPMAPTTTPRHRFPDLLRAASTVLTESPALGLCQVLGWSSRPSDQLTALPTAAQGRSR
jgi:hypothetical protein